MTKVIKVENLSKAYQLGNYGTGTISRDLERTWARIRGKEDPFLKIGEVNNRITKGESDIVWSLKDINFEIEQGDAVGIIGRNGAGKSTLLKILSRVTSPTTGSVKIKGRIASLLEVGTGFHPELSGRENIYLNGAILGMRKAEIKRKFDEIVDFAGVERYIDTPVKRYSSGMYVRLAFAVAAHLESEILIIDEVLAVGDAEFQKKCLGKMGDISKGEGRTVLFVSHNMGSIMNLCNKGIVINNGIIKTDSDINTAVKSYNNLLENNAGTTNFNGTLANSIQIDKVHINDMLGHVIVKPDENIHIKLNGELYRNFDPVVFIIALFYNGTRIFTLREKPNGKKANAGPFEADFNIKGGLLRPGNYTLAIGAWGENDDDDWLWGLDAAVFSVAEIWTDNLRRPDHGIINGEFIRIS
jgi:lipopolysaccharide transport system ATP-binding protein